MGKRLTKIYTRTGDDGTTGLGDNTRVSKDSLRVHAMGDVDELNSNLGVLLAEPLPADVRELLVVIQHELFNLGAHLATRDAHRWSTQPPVRERLRLDHDVVVRDAAPLRG